MSVWATSSHAAFRLNKRFISPKTGPGTLWKCDSCIHTYVSTWHHLPLNIFRRYHCLASAIYIAQGCVNFIFYLKCALFVPSRNSKVQRVIASYFSIGGQNTRLIWGCLWLRGHRKRRGILTRKCFGLLLRFRSRICKFGTVYANLIPAPCSSSSQTRLVWRLYNRQVLKCCVFAELVKHKRWNCELSTDITPPPTECYSHHLGQPKEKIPVPPG